MQDFGSGVMYYIARGVPLSQESDTKLRRHMLARFSLSMRGGLAAQLLVVTEYFPAYLCLYE